MKWRIVRILYVVLMGTVGYGLAYYLDQTLEIRVAFTLVGLAGATFPCPQSQDGGGPRALKGPGGSPWRLLFSAGGIR